MALVIGGNELRLNIPTLQPWGGTASRLSQAHRNGAAASCVADRRASIHSPELHIHGAATAFLIICSAAEAVHCLSS
jgi:hypothetical protein